MKFFPTFLAVFWTLSLAFLSACWEGGNPYYLDNDKLVSIINLLATPERYDGEEIQAAGYAIIEFEDTAIYLSEADASYIILENSIWISLDPRVTESSNEWKEFDREWVLVQGIFHEDGHNHLGSITHSIDNIKRLEVLRSRTDFSKARGE